LPLVGDFMSFNEIVETLNRQGHSFSFTRVPREVFATFFPSLPRSPRRSPGSRRIPIWVRIRPTRSRSPTNSGPATDQVCDVGPSEYPGFRYCGFPGGLNHCCLMRASRSAKPA
jgi:hypothetical protein